MEEVSEHEVEALSAEAERGYEGRLRTEFVSRPPDEEIDALRRIVFRVPAKVRAAAQKRADKEECALSELAATALREYLKRPVAVRDPSKDS
jgi:predicted HicB family RNase H-like nuclease